jgi:hypothetical protein
VVWDRRVPKYDAFGREIGEDTLKGLGGKPKSRRDASPVRAPERKAAVPAPPLEGSGPEAPRQRQVTPARAPAAPPARVVRRSGAGRGCLGSAVTVITVAAVAIGGAAGLIGGSGGSSGTITGPAKPQQAAPAAAAPRGVGPRSLVRRANLAAALRRLRSTELRLDHLRVAPERIDATLLTRGGRLRSVQVQPGGATERFGPDSGPGFDGASTIPFARLNPAAPERLARRGAAKLHVPVAKLMYLLPTFSSGTLTWAAYFPHSRYVLGDAAGRYVRSVP